MHDRSSFLYKLLHVDVWTNFFLQLWRKFICRLQDHVSMKMSWPICVFSWMPYRVFLIRMQEISLFCQMKRSKHCVVYRTVGFLKKACLISYTSVQDIADVSFLKWIWEYVENLHSKFPSIGCSKLVPLLKETLILSRWTFVPVSTYVQQSQIDEILSILPPEVKQWYKYAWH